ncbi:hypothetical protein M441DRAFT_452220 [Trichoderma asperellum CBS 433.97]|uniref:Uncharacterized protein n=1 Tax=Trichoderma asperellum (strain ATCC 204424 / CBS 433.97 / NBRC 101777) TaxID=1042311 RepID=A0A2T3ZM39_TRIA4|nr:hypothetical protein M441DRAFT_452220 [Trichoderma asperellum CBS 433.97]PTB45868.1 hypothetical protein M441DRAFT_452220 [Trichoderma asperellum CBS 433.97]
MCCKADEAWQGMGWDGRSTAVLYDIRVEMPNWAARLRDACYYPQFSATARTASRVFAHPAGTEYTLQVFSPSAGFTPYKRALLPTVCSSSPRSLKVRGLSPIQRVTVTAIRERRGTTQGAGTVCSILWEPAALRSFWALRVTWYLALQVPRTCPPGAANTGTVPVAARDVQVEVVLVPHVLASEVEPPQYCAHARPTAQHPPQANNLAPAGGVGACSIQYSSIPSLQGPRLIN